MLPPFFTNSATAPRTMASPPAATWIGKSMRPCLDEQGRWVVSVARHPLPLDCLLMPENAQRIRPAVLRSPQESPADQHVDGAMHEVGARVGSRRRKRHL